MQVKHLEVSSASMAEDLCRKSAIIETYVMDSRIGQYLLTSLTPPPNLASDLPFPLLLPHCLLSSCNSAKALTRPQLLEGMGKSRPGCPCVCLSLTSALPFCLGIYHCSALLSPAWLCLSLPPLLSPSLLSVVPRHLVSLWLLPVSPVSPLEVFILSM